MGYPLQYSWGFPGGSVCKESVCNAGALGSIQGWEVTLEELGSLSSILTWRIPTDRWQAAVHGVSKSRTRLSD